MTTTFILISVLTAYLLGSIPNAVWVGKVFFGIDVREHGSGNAGATNTLRVLGKKPGIAVFALDFLKGLLASSLMHLQNEIATGTAAFHDYQLMLGMVAVLGHVFPVFAGFKGGKGIATLVGMVVGVSWMVALVCLTVFVLTVYLTKYISVGSMVGTSVSPFATWFFYGPKESIFIYFCIGITLLVVYTHRTNITRLRAGTESRFSFNKKPEIAR